MADPTTPPTESPDTSDTPKQKKAAERIADLEAQLALMADGAARAEKAEAALADATSRTTALEKRVASLADSLGDAIDSRLGPLLARLESSTEDAQRAIDTTPAKLVGSLMLDDRMSEADILAKVRAMRDGKIAPDVATRFRTDARMWPDRGTPLAEKHEGKTIPLRTEVTREDFSPESLAHHIASGALIPIA